MKLKMIGHDKTTKKYVSAEEFNKVSGVIPGDSSLLTPIGMIQAIRSS